MNTLILGVGNLLLSDEAVGVRIVEGLERDYRFAPASSCSMAAPPAWSCSKRWPVATTSYWRTRCAAAIRRVPW